MVRAKGYKMVATTRFKIGDFVALAESEETAIKITSVVIETCPGGTQIHYVGKGYQKERAFGIKNKEFTWRLATKNDRFNEAEMGDVVK